MSKLHPGMTVELPDGAVIVIDDRGNYTINDKNAKVVYQANNNRAFNRFVNASDILAEFIAFAGAHGATREEMLALPVERFIQFLIVRAAEADGEPVPGKADLLALPPPKRLVYRCVQCGRFVKKMAWEARLPFCNEREMLAYSRSRAALTV